MQCRICGNENNNKFFEVQEKQHCFKDQFPYFQCSKCDCVQIVSIPENIGKYYPDSYYSFNSGALLNRKLSFFQKIQSDYLIYGKQKLLGPLMTLGYRPPVYFSWMRNLDLKKTDRILDIGSGSGEALKKMYQLGYSNLTGVDPYIKNDYSFTKTFHIYKKDPLEFESDQQFDCIMLHHSLEHMQFQKQTLQKIKRLLKPAGKLLIRIPVFSQPLWDKYGVNVVSLDAPRHFFIHSVKSMRILCDECGFTIDKTAYDAEEFSFWASEEYSRGICLSYNNSYARDRKKSIFSKKQIKVFKQEIKKLNSERQSDNAAFYLHHAASYRNKP